MSALALAQTRTFPIPLARSFSEVDALRSIGHLASNADHEETAIRDISTIALRVPGIFGLRFEPQAHFAHLPLFESTKSAGTGVSAIARVAAHGTDWGQLRIFFDPRVATIESPVRFARFLAQQIALVLDRIWLLRRLDSAAASLAALHVRLNRRKLVHRAAGLFARQRGIPQTEGLLMLIRYARSNRRRLFDVAEAVILGSDATVFRYPFSRKALKLHVL